jgi:hypothetical protein
MRLKAQRLGSTVFLISTLITLLCIRVNAYQKTGTATTLSSTPNPQRINQSVTLTATVTSAAGAATGTVVFKAGTTILGTAAVSAGQATLTKSFVTTATITAQYSADANNLASTSAPLTEQIVSRFPTTTTLISSSISSSYGQFVSLLARVSAPAVPTGVVLFRNGATILGVGTLDATGAAFLTKNNMPVGRLSLSAEYMGSAILAPSTGTLIQTVNQAASTIKLQSLVNPSSSGQHADFVATVNSSTGVVPTGTVMFTSGGTTLGTATLSGGKAVFNTNVLPAGTNSVDATYSGNINVASSSTMGGVTTGPTGPLRPLASNPRWFSDGSGKAIFLSGSHTWNTFQDTDQSASPAAFDFNGYVSFLKSHGQNVTILWKKDLPTYCSWGAGGTWQMAPFPWQRTGGSSGTQLASDGRKAFDLSLFDQSYFDRLRARAVQLQQNGIYAIIELFDGLGLAANRCANDGYPFSVGNNVNGISDGGGTNSMTMTAANAITNYQDAYAQKVIDTLNDLPNVLWEVSEEAPDNSTWWQNHMISLIHTYEAGKPLQHPVGFPTLNVSGATDTTLYNSNADWVAPVARISPTSSCGSGTPACKVNINDSDHSYFGMWNDSAQTNRNYLWENFENGNSVIFMDPYFIYWSSGSRNLCQNPVNGVCNAVDTRWDNLRNNMGAMVSYANRMNLATMTPQPVLSSTGYCLANAGSEYLVYEPGTSGSLTVTVTPATYAFEWFDPSSLSVVSTGTVAVSSGNQSFTKPFSGDAVLYLKAQ